MFKTEAQQAMVCETLGRLVGFPGLWTTSGPTERSIAMLKGRFGGFSHGEALMVRAAWEVWNGRGKMPLNEALHTLDGRNLRALGGLLVAMADPDGLAVDAWLARYGACRAGETVTPAPEGGGQ